MNNMLILSYSISNVTLAFYCDHIEQNTNTLNTKCLQLSCKSHHEMRVYELCAIANNSEVTEFALKYASKINSEILVDKLTELQNEQQMRFLEHCSSEYVDR